MLPLLILTGHYLDAIDSGSSNVSVVILLVIIYVAIYSPGAGVSVEKWYPDQNQSKSSYL
jgi:hypothetical protein